MKIIHQIVILLFLTGMLFAQETETPTLATPAASSSDNAELDIDFTLPEAASSGTVKMTFTETGGDVDPNDPHVITFNSNFETADQHTATLMGSDLSNNPNLSSVNTNTNDALVENAIYDVMIEYQDALQNAADDATINNGCLYFIPGSHTKRYLRPEPGTPPARVFELNPELLGNQQQ